jgi:hypothetical protein
MGMVLLDKSYGLDNSDDDDVEPPVVAYKGATILDGTIRLGDSFPGPMGFRSTRHRGINLSSSSFVVGRSFVTTTSTGSEDVTADHVRRCGAVADIGRVGSSHKEELLLVPYVVVFVQTDRGAVMEDDCNGICGCRYCVENHRWLLLVVVVVAMVHRPIILL